jgi:hypothetical protein
VVATTPASRKAKGRRFQQSLREDLITQLEIDPGDILSTAMGQSGCDLYLSPAAREQFPFGVEAKHQERISLPSWWRQCAANAEAEELSPLLVFRRNRKEPLAVLRWSDLLALLREIHVITEWADQTAEAILEAGDYSTDVGQWLALQSLAVHYRDHIRGHDHRWENLASGLTGVEP